MSEHHGPRASLDVLAEFTAFMDRSFEGKWAYSGSFAILLHALKKNHGFRTPGDIDILVQQEELKDHTSCNVFNVLYAIQKEFGQKGKMSSAKMTAKEGTIEGCSTAKCGATGIIPAATVKIDVGMAGAKFGEISECEPIQLGRTTHPVMKLRELFDRLRDRSNLLATGKASDLAKWKSDMDACTAMDPALGK